MAYDMVSPLEKSIAFGFQVEDFLASDIGKYLIKRADEEIECAVEELKHADPDAPSVIRSLQSKIAVAESIQYWLAEAIQDGQNSMQELNEGA
jgi:hypothetical protein